jgi:hypothetical protein
MRRARTRHRRAELDAALSKAEADTGAKPSVGAGDAGAAALSAVLALLGWTLPAGALAPWLVLAGVLALEVGSSLAVVLVWSMDAGGSKPQGRPPAAAADNEPMASSSAVLSV